MLPCLVLSVTSTCPLRCRYCGVNAGPDNKSRLSLHFMKRIIDESYEIGIRGVVVFTGGEPLVLGKDLLSAIGHASNRGLSTRVVTSAYWASSRDRALNVLGDLKKAGLTELNLSCDDFHQEYVPLDYVKWANEAAKDLGIPALLAVKGIRGSRIDVEFIENYFGVKLAVFRKGQVNPKNDVATFTVTVPVGRGSDSIDESSLTYCAPEEYQGPCTSVLERVVVTSEGHLAICCGIGRDDVPETTIGSLHRQSLVSRVT